MEYSKPHLNYNDQVDLLVSRGMDVPERPRAVAALKRVGYYRLSAYTYPLRQPAIEGDARRSEQFVSGARFDDALALCDFDDRIRTTLLSGLQKLEIGMRVQLGYQLGKTDPFGHTTREHLDQGRCSSPPQTISAQQAGLDAHEAWLERYEQLRTEAKQEDYVKHFIVKYDGKLPVWVATEFMTFGCLTALFNLLSDRDAKAIGRAVGVPNRDMLHGWLRALNVLRNHCAHNSRIWNRATVYPPKRPPAGFIPRLDHLKAADNNRVYFLAALCAHLLLQLDPETQWPSQFVTTMGKFLPVHGMTPENTMGFPSGWKELDLWRRRVA